MKKIAASLFALLLMFGVASVATASGGDGEWHTWATTNTSEPTGGTVNYPQTYVGEGRLAPDCGVWYQQDFYTHAGESNGVSIEEVIADGTLTNGEDHHLTNQGLDGAQMWRFVYGGDCEPESTPSPSVTPEPEVDFCDRGDRPGGVNIGKWLDRDNGGSAAECFDAEIIESCGMVDDSVTGPAGIAWGLQWKEGAGVAPEYPANNFPANFPEDYNGGSADVSYWLVGGESDYGKRSGLPNLWGESATVTVNTDCEDAPGEPEEPKEPTTEKDKTVLCSGWIKTVITTTDANGNESVGTEWEHDPSLQTCDDGENG